MKNKLTWVQNENIAKENNLNIKVTYYKIFKKGNLKGIKYPETFYFADTEEIFKYKKVVNMSRSLDYKLELASFCFPCFV